MRRCVSLASFGATLFCTVKWRGQAVSPGDCESGAQRDERRAGQAEGDAATQETRLRDREPQRRRGVAYRGDPVRDGAQVLARQMMEQRHMGRDAVERHREVAAPQGVQGREAVAIEQGRHDQGSDRGRLEIIVVRHGGPLRSPVSRPCDTR